MGTTQQGALGPPGAPWWVVLPSEHPRRYLGPLGVFWSIKNLRGVAFGLCLVLISCDVKNMQKTATGTWHYVNRLVPKNDIK